jgi:hypothetical protein
MSNRLFNGNTNSEDGWPYVDQGSCTWVTVPGTSVTLQIQNGQPLAIMGAFAADFNAYIEPLRDADSAAWTEGNSVATSNHPGGTAMDLNWDSHPFQVRGTFNAAQQATIDELLNWYQDTIFWGGRWDSPIDEMHWQMGGSTYNNPATGDFIARKIRPDGFSTFRRDNAPVPVPIPAPAPTPAPLSKADGYAVLIIQEGQRRGITPRGIEIALATALVESNIQIYSNEAVPESMNIPHDAVGSDAYSVGIFQQQVRDTGSGWWWGDAATCMDPTSSAGLFYDRLAKLDYNGPNSPGSYAQAVQSSAFPDRYDQRFNDAVAIYNRLATGAPPPTQGEDMAAVSQEDWARVAAQMDRVFHEVADLRISRSSLREPDEGPLDTWSGFALNDDANDHVPLMRLLAGYGHPPTIAKLKRVAAMPVDKPGREGDCLIAQAILADVTSAPPAVAAAPVTPMTAPVAPVAPQVVYVDRPVAAAPAALPAVVAEPPASTDKSMGDVVKTIVDAVEQLKLADALTIQDRATLAASIKILEMKNGAQI